MEDKLDQLIAHAKFLEDLGDVFVKATEELKSVENKFTQEDLDKVFVEVDKFKEALTALKV